MINFQRLRYFCAMVEQGGIHKAARSLGLSQPPLSLALRELEEEVGCQLVFRSGRNWIVTEAGQRLYEEGRAILAQTDSLAKRIAMSPHEIQGEVRAGFSTSCVSLFQRALAGVAKTSPDVSCHVLFADSERLANYVRQRNVDFAVLYLPVDGDDFNIMPLRPQKLVALYSRLLPKPAAPELSLAEICENPLLLPRRWKGGGIYTIFAEASQRLGLKPRVICHTQSTYILRDILDNAPAVAILPQGEICESHPGHWDATQIKELSRPLTPAIVTLKNTFLPMAAHHVISLLLKDSGHREK